MDLGKDIVQKIRSAVKSKLLDLGSYVDDELPDYVMVMVANKKSETQMTEDLSLFLGSKTSKFTSWLHNLLNRLTSISIGDSASRDEILSKSCNNTTNKKAGSRPKETKRAESKSSNSPKESDTNSEVLEPVISLKSERDYIDDIDKDDDEEEEVASSHEEVRRPAEVVTSSATTSVSRSQASRKRTRELTIKKEKHQQKPGVGRKGVQDPRSEEPRTNGRPPVLKSSQKGGIAVSAEGAEGSHPTTMAGEAKAETTDRKTTPDRLQIPPVETTPVAFAGKNPVPDLQYDREDQFYPYEIAGDVEMMPSEFGLEQQQQQQLGGFAVAAATGGGGGMEDPKRVDADIKSRKVLVGARNPELKPERMVSVANVWEEPSAPSTDRRAPEEPPVQVTNFIVTLDGACTHLGQRILDDDPEDWEMEESRLGWSVPAGSTRVHRIGSRPVVICDNGDDDDEEEEDEENEEEEDEEDESLLEKRRRTSERCRYWPKCKAGDDCSYHHPTLPCKAFPNCHFKDKCLFIHPECRFNSSCTNPNCNFTHTAPRALSIAPPTVILQPIKVPLIRTVSIGGSGPRKARPKANLPPSQIQCRFFPNCSDMNCPYSHPKPCRYGLSCSIKNRCPFSHPILPSKEKLKWFAKI